MDLAVAVMREVAKNQISHQVEGEEGDIFAPPKKKGKIQHGTHIFDHLLDALKQKKDSRPEYIRLIGLFVSKSWADFDSKQFYPLFEALISMLERDSSSLQNSLTTALASFAPIGQNLQKMTAQKETPGLLRFPRKEILNN